MEKIMKRLFSLFFILLPIIAYSSDAPVERWNLRVERLQKIAEELSHIQQSSEAEKIIADEIKSSKEFIALLNRYNLKDNSLSSDTKKYNIAEIENQVREIAPPVFSIYFSLEMLKSSQAPETKEKVKNDINQYLQSQNLPIIKKDSKVSEDLSRKYIIHTYSLKYDEIKKATIDKILSEVQYELSRSDYKTTDEDIAILISTIAQKICEKPLLSFEDFYEKNLIDIPQWQNYLQEKNHEKAKLKAAIEFANSENIKLSDAEKDRGIGQIDSAIFKTEASEIIMASESSRSNTSISHNSLEYIVPDFSNFSKALSDIDKYRKGLVVSISGLEDKQYIKKASNNFKGIAIRYISPYEKHYAKEKERINSLKKQNKAMIYNEEIFNISEKQFLDLKEKLNRYADMSAQFSESIYNACQKDEKDIISMHESKLDYNLKTITFMSRLIEDSSNISLYAKKPIDIFKGIYNKLRVEMAALLVIEPLSNETRSLMRKETIGNYNESNSNFRTKSSAIITSSRRCYENFETNLSKKELKDKSREKNLEANLAQEEIDRLFQSAEKLTAIFSSMTYTQESFKKYLSAYNQIYNDINSGNNIDSYLQTISSGSIISLVSDFDPARIDAEKKIRTILKTEATSSLSSAIALMQYYSRMKIEIKFKWSDAEINKIKEELKSEPGIVVSSWKMNSSNYRQIDQNIAESLKKIIAKKTWDPSSEINSSQAEKFTAGENLEFYLQLPTGWQRANNTLKENLSLEIISPDRDAKIIIHAQKTQESVEEISKQWTSSMGFEPLSKEWKKEKEKDFLISASKATNGKIMGSYLIEKNGYVIIISGIASTKRYSGLNKYLKEIFNSLTF